MEMQTVGDESLMMISLIDICENRIETCQNPVIDKSLSLFSLIENTREHTDLFYFPI